MKKIINSLFMLLLMCSFSSCLHSGLEDLPEFSDAFISSASRVEYRYISDEISPASGQPIVKFASLSQTSTANKDSGTLIITVTVPGGFPPAELQNLTDENLTVSLNISTAARIVPIEGAAALGVPADWSKPNRYVVTAADGTKKEWIITLNLTK